DRAACLERGRLAREPGDPVGDLPGLPASRAGEDEERTVAVEHGVPLGGVEPVEDVVVEASHDSFRAAVCPGTRAMVSLASGDGNAGAGRCPGWDARCRSPLSLPGLES